MAVTAELQIYKAMQPLAAKLCELTKNFPKDYKVGIGQAIIKLSVDCIALLCQANDNPEERTKALTQFCTNVDTLRCYLHLCEQLHIITDAQRVETFRDFDSVSRQASGWLKASKQADKQNIHLLAVEIASELHKLT